MSVSDKEDIQNVHSGGSSRPELRASVLRDSQIDLKMCVFSVSTEM